MPKDQLVLLAHVYDQVDILPAYLEWYINLGVDRILVQDMGSTDGSQDVLTALASKYPLEWFSLKDSNLRNHESGNTGDPMARLAREKYDARWLMMCDADEFLCLRNETLDLALDRAELRGLTSINIPCFNMTGPSIAEDTNPLEALTLRIEKPYVETPEQQMSGDLPLPYIFIRHPVKSIVLTTAFSSFVAGSHGTNVTFGKVGEIPGARFNHYPIRGFAKFQQKVRNAEKFLQTNDHLEDWWGWHWRRWIRLDRQGRLKDDYDKQFPSVDEQANLIKSGMCIRDQTVSSWVSISRRNETCQTSIQPTIERG